MKALIYPKGLAPGQKLWFVLRYLNWTWTNNINDSFDVAFHWNYKNSLSPEDLAWMEDINVPIINQRCTEIRKDFLHRYAKEYFGYDIAIDPTKHRGTCVMKSTQNAIHNGRFVQCPIPKSMLIKSKTGTKFTVMYQKLIDTRFDFDKLRDIRIPVVAYKIPTVVIKEIGVSSTFHPQKNDYFKAYLSHDDRFLTQGEKQGVIHIAKKMGIEFGEFDALRDNSTGLLYVVDANPIPMGTMFKHMTLTDKEFYLSKVSGILKNYIVFLQNKLKKAK